MTNKQFLFMQVIDLPIQSTIIEILKDIIQDWDLEADEISLETQLVADLSFASIDIIHFVVAIEDHFKQKFGFAQLLMQDGRYVDDLSVGQIVDFVSKQSNKGVL
ncbi:MAG: phosphopantetheine-binding protein [Fischerella sp. CENA71]|nr:phosphopantetheine-binding protein [Fischerella sp. CENA71]